MSTRALIGRKVGNGWIANYHHWDGYPAGLGRELVKVFQGHFEGNADGMLKFLIDDHPAGWSTIIGQDLTKPVGWGKGGAECYCHGERSEESSLITEVSSSFMGAEYLYVVDPEIHLMVIYSRRYTDGSRAVQFFGVDASAVDDQPYWKPLAGLNLNEPCPETDWWEGLDQE